MTLLQELRAATRDAHDRLEHGLDVPGRCRSPRAYGALLADFRSVYAPIEAALDRAPATLDAVPDWAQRRKTPWLDQDLDALARRPHPEVAVPDINTAEHVVGVLYVLEGATLGGALLVRDLQHLPHRFFASYGARRGAMWRSFRSSVDALESRGADPAAVVQAARDTFATLERACLQPSR